METPTTPEQTIKQPEILNKQTIIKLLSCAGLAGFWVIFVWNFWDKGPYALGLNFFVFLALFFGLFVWTLKKEGKFAKHDLIWTIPLSLVILSYLIYENPFLKATSLLVFSAGFAVFYNYAYLENKKSRHWDVAFLLKMIERIFSFLGKIGESMTLYIEMMIPAGKAKRKVISKIIAGVALFLVVALTVFIPLLAAADPVFSGKMQGIYVWIKDVFSVPVVYKIITFVVLSVIFSALLFAWGKRFDHEERGEGDRKIDSIISGIVLGGVLAIYLLFLWVQIERLWVGALPFDFRETENLVKSGFWQLLFLSMINIVIYLFTYRKTVPAVQWILGGFTIASLLLLSSAAYRMALYVTYYGFSYEKFFASYTVLFCLILFVWLISRLFKTRRSNIVKFVAVLFLWMYGIVTVLPVEQFIFRANMRLSKLEESRIKLYELTMLSPDVLSLVKIYESQGLLKEEVKIINDDGSERTEIKSGWGDWIERQEKILAEKRWYEKNLNCDFGD